MKPASIALRVVVGLGILLSPVGGTPHVVRRLLELRDGGAIGGVGWLQIGFHLGVPLALLIWAGMGIRQAHRRPDHD